MSGELSITFLGTSSAQPSSTRNMSSLCLQMDGDLWMFDCGEGTQHQIRKSQCDLKVSKIQAIFITHNHGDHLFGLPGLLCTLSGGITEEGRIIDIFGPSGIRQFLRVSLAISYSMLNYSIRIHELVDSDHPPSCGLKGALPFEIQGKNIFSNNGTWDIESMDSRIESIVAGSLTHTVPSVGYVITEKTLPGSLNANAVKPILMKNKDALATQGIKNPMMLMKDIKAGKTINLPDGSVITPNDVLGPPKVGRKVVILGDTSYSDSLLKAAKGCDVLVHEATNAKVGDEDKSFDEVEQSAISHGHSTPQMAGKFANDVNAKWLMLNHFSSRYKGDQSDESIAVMKQIEKLAASEFHGKVTAAHDFLTLRIPRV